MVWILPTRGRPEMCRRTLEACEETGFEGVGIVSFDGELYDWFREGAPWISAYHEKPIGVMSQLNWVVDKWPKAHCYGCISDDMLPRTKRWQQKLEKAAGDWNIAYTDDNLIHGHKSDGRPWMSGAWCIGGELVRTVGWLGLPGTYRSSTDLVYCAIGNRLGLMRYLDDVLVEHLHWQNGTRERDQTDLNGRKRDYELTRQWGNGLIRPGFETTCRKIEAAMAAQREAA